MRKRLLRHGLMCANTAHSLTHSADEHWSSLFLRCKHQTDINYCSLKSISRDRAPVFVCTKRYAEGDLQDHLESIEQTTEAEDFRESTYHLWAIVIVIEMNLSVRWCSLHFFQSFLLLAVVLLVEVGEEEQEHDTVKANPHHKAFWVLAVGPKELELMCKDRDELNLRGERTTISVRDVMTQVVSTLTIWNAVKYFFHQMNFWYFGPMAATM